MNSRTYNVLVTGVGAIIGYGIVRNLQKAKYSCNIVGMDIFSDAVGQQWCHKFIQGVRADSDSYISFINEIIKDEKIDLVIPGIEQDHERMTANFHLLDKKPKYALNNKKLFNIFNNKKRTYDFLKNEISLIPSQYYCENFFKKAKSKLKLPFILKKDVSYASKGVALIESEKDFYYFMDKFGCDCMAQKYLRIEQSEYTCSLFGLGNGSFINPTCLQRELSGEGATNKAINIVIEEELLEILHKISKKCMFEGPTNIQFIKHENKYLLLEINARTSSSTSIREFIGVNEAEMCMDYYLLNKIPDIKKQRYVKVVRFIEDLYFDSNHL